MSQGHDFWGGAHGHLYDGFVKCSRCRFYARDAAVVTAHEKICKGHPKSDGIWCMRCRFDCDTMDELRAHQSECVNEIMEIVLPIITMDYSFPERP